MEITPRYTIVTPTLSRHSLIQLCETVNAQSFTSWEHILLVDEPLNSGYAKKLAHPNRRIFQCDRPHKFGNACRRNIHPSMRGDYVWYVDDDNYLADDRVLETLNQVTAPWAMFPIQRLGERFFSYPPELRKIDGGSLITRRDLALWPDTEDYCSDWNYIDALKKKYEPEVLSNVRPLMVMPVVSEGKVSLRYTIVTPTLLRSSLLRLCASIENQTSKSWQHIVIVDSQISNEVIGKIDHPQRIVVRCEQPHQNWGHTCRHAAYSLMKGEYVWYLDDDNYLADPNVLKDLEQVVEKWAIFPVLRCGERWFEPVPCLGKTDTGSFLLHRSVAQWPNLNRYDTDGVFAEALLHEHGQPQVLDERPLMVMPEVAVSINTAKAPENPKVSIFTCTHRNQFLREAYDSIKDQDFYEWVIVYNNGAVPIEFNDPRVKSHVLYKAPEMVGPLKAYACEQCRGDVLLEFDSDDMLAPDAVEEVRKAFSDNPDVGFVYSNTIHIDGEGKQRDKFGPEFGWQYRPAEFQCKPYEALTAFPPDAASVSRIWYSPDHLRAFRRSAYHMVQGYSKTMKVLDDSDLIMRLFLNTKFLHIDKPLYVYRVHGGNAWLKYNDEIQKGVYPLYDQYIHALVDRWCDLKGLQKVMLNKERDLNIPESSAGVIRSFDTLCNMRDPVRVMKKIYRALAPGGFLLAQVPSTDGRGAFQDPNHVSFWNQNSFLYYTNAVKASYIGAPVRFQAVRLYTNERNNEGVCWTVAHLVSLKDGYRPCGPLEI